MKVFFLELNEFSLPLLDEAADTLNLQNVQRILSFSKSTTKTDDAYESGYLEPWVQWVSVHTGVPAKTHQIKHLGDAPHLVNPQIWEKLAEEGITSGIWGAMNASRGKNSNVLFFLPDPWTFSENAYPSNLQSLLNPLRYTVKNYGKKRLLPLLKHGVKFLLFLKREKLLFSFLKRGGTLIKDVFRFSGKPFVFISFFDLFSTKLFLKYKKKYDPDFSLLFLNSLAHLMHHQWHLSPISENTPLGHGMLMIDEMLGDIFDAVKEEDLFIVTNALSQKNTEEETPWVLYRQIDQEKFLNTIGIFNVQVEAHMTHDAHLIFNSKEAAISAKMKLESARMQKLPLFLIETYEEDPCKLFYKMIFTEELASDATFEVFGKSYPFFSLFKKIVKRTGKHIQEGTLFSNQSIFEETLYNHEIGAVLEAHLTQKHGIRG